MHTHLASPAGVAPIEKAKGVEAPLLQGAGVVHRGGERALWKGVVYQWIGIRVDWLVKRGVRAVRLHMLRAWMYRFEWCPYIQPQSTRTRRRKNAPGRHTSLGASPRKLPPRPLNSKAPTRAVRMAVRVLLLRGYWCLVSRSVNPTPMYVHVHYYTCIHVKRTSQRHPLGVPVIHVLLPEQRPSPLRAIGPRG